MTQRIAPNNNLPATHFIEVWSNGIYENRSRFPEKISKLSFHLNATKFRDNIKTIAIFRIRENKLPTLHKF